MSHPSHSRGGYPKKIARDEEANQTSIIRKAAIIEGRGFLTPAFSFRHRRFAPGARSTGRGGMRTGKLGSGVLAIDQAAACSKPPIASRVMSSVSSSVKGSSAVMLKGS